MVVHGSMVLRIRIAMIQKKMRGFHSTPYKKLLGIDSTLEISFSIIIVAHDLRVHLCCLAVHNIIVVKNGTKCTAKKKTLSENTQEE